MKLQRRKLAAKLRDIQAEYSADKAIHLTQEEFDEIIETLED